MDEQSMKISNEEGNRAHISVVTKTSAEARRMGKKLEKEYNGKNLEFGYLVEADIEWPKARS